MPFGRALFRVPFFRHPKGRPTRKNGVNSIFLPESNFRLTLQNSFYIPRGESSIFDDFRNFSKKQGLTISLPKQNLERTEGERIILRLAEARGFLR